MTQTRKELVQAALNKQKVDRIPVGFWFHFLPAPEQADALARPELAAANIAGHRAFYEAFQPDFVKLMSDGYFIYPNQGLAEINSAADFARIRPLGKNHPWIQQQVALVKQLQEIFGQDVLTFYNVFSPARVLEWSLANWRQGWLGDLIAQDKAAVKAGLEVVASDLSDLSRLVIEQGGASGIYFSVQNIEDKRITQTVYEEIIAPVERQILGAANKAGENNILHICGYEGHHNDLSWYKDYEAKAYNWAVKVENIPLEEGREIFGDKAVIGGFGNAVTDLLYRGTPAEVTAETLAILQAAGQQGVILGADCTVPADIDLKHLEWVRQAGRI